MKKSRQVLATDDQESLEGRGERWIEEETAGCAFRDVRHGKRLRQLLEQFSARVGATTPWAAQDWANTKAAYRFFANRRIREANILVGHFASTRERAKAVSGFPLLVLHDTTEFSYRHKDTAPIGIVMKTITGASKPGRRRYHTRCGILMHSSLAVTARTSPPQCGQQPGSSASSV